MRKYNHPYFKCIFYMTYAMVNNIYDHCIYFILEARQLTLIYC